jgi:hypothetical protein
MIFRALVLAALLLMHGELRAKPLPDNAGFAPKLIIYLTKGPVNSCGPGCDRWIAIEGTVDQAAAARWPSITPSRTSSFTVIPRRS